MQSGKWLGLPRSGREDVGHSPLYEDMLTSAVFGRISYLPDDVIGHFISDIIPGLAEAGEIGEVREFHFWRRYPLSRLGCNVEPDVVLVFPHHVISFEAKRNDGSEMQKVEQIELQREALRDYFSDQTKWGIKSIFVVALGGHRAWTPMQSADGGRINLTWRQLAEGIDRLRSRGVGARLIDDILWAFTHHGIAIRDPLWFIDFHATGINSTGIDRLHPCESAQLRQLDCAAIACSSFPAFGARQ